MSTTLEQQFARAAFVKALENVSDELAKKTAVQLYDLLQLTRQTIRDVAKQDLNMGNPMPVEEGGGGTHLVEIPADCHERLMRFLESYPQVDLNTVWVNALTLYLDRRGV